MIVNLVFENFILQLALLDCTSDWYMNLDRKMFNLVVQIDLKKAFDTVCCDVPRVTNILAALNL